MSFRITELTCNYMNNPIGLDELPYFSYKLSSEDPSEFLAAYEIVVSNKNTVVWDSGRVEADRQILIKYEGQRLQPQTRYSWHVSVWNKEGERTDSQFAFFETGRMKPVGWEAKWITTDPILIYIGGAFKSGSETTAPYMRREFEINKPVEDATLYISGVGYYQCWINGVSVKDTVLDPPFTEYDKAVMYGTHKITNLHQGLNAIGIAVGDGLYNSDPEDVWNFANAVWRDHAKCLCILNILYTDGTTEQIISDRSFKGTSGPIIANSLRGLEKYDAGRELGEWTMPGYDDSSWQPVAITKAPGGELTGHYTTPIRITREYEPKEIKKISDTVWLVDAGENTSGWAEISVTAPKGTVINLTYDEEFDEELKPRETLVGALRPAYRQSFQTNCYIASGKGREVWHPVYQYNGFRYILVTCESGIPENISFRIHEVRSNLESAGEFHCSDETVNKIQRISCQATKTNFHNMPTDCPHREKMGWTGDAQLSAEQLLFNFNAAAAYNRWMDDILRSQRITGQLPGIIPSTGWGFNWGGGPSWDSACAVIPYYMYLFKNDKRILEKMYPCVKKNLAFLDTMQENGIIAYGLDDWNPPRDSWHKKCELAVTDTASYYNSTVIASKMAKILGTPKEAEYYGEKADSIRKSFRRHFIKSTQNELELINCTKSQSTLACMLYYGLTEEWEKSLFLRDLINEIHIMDDHFDVGAIGMMCICNVLTMAGEAELMMKAVTNPTYPSYADLVINKDATTLWEDFKGIGSHNHHYFGSVSAGFYKGLAGINPDEKHPGFKHTVFRPQFVSMLDHVDAWHISPYGKVASEWTRQGENITIKLTVPSNCTGELQLPSDTVFADSGKTFIKLTSGIHKFQIKNKI